MSNTCPKVDIGGQAVLEGVMMKAPDHIAVAVRRENGDVIVKREAYTAPSKQHKWMGLPFIRGSVNMVQMLSMGMKTLTDAADMLGVESEEPSKFEKWLAEKLGKNIDKVVMAVADYAQKATNVDYLHVWLADGANNHCECDECRKMTPSDWYITMMNEIDEELTSRDLSTRIVFIEYVDTTWAPEKVTIKNPARFSLLIAAITRDYTEAVDPNPDFEKIPTVPFKLNDNVFPKSVNEYLAYAKKWQEQCPGVPSFVYEYHYWVPQFRDVAVLDAARMVYDDIRGYKANGCNGIVEDGSQRSFYPNGFSFYVYGSTLFDTSVDFETLKEDYFSHAYGEDWREVVSFLEKLGKAIDFRYANGKLSIDEGKSKFYNPSLVPSFLSAYEILDDFEPFVKAHMNCPKRAQTVSYRLLNRHLEYCRKMIPILCKKAEGRGEEARDDFYRFLDDFGRYEQEMEVCYDQYMCGHSWRFVFGKQGFSITY